MSDQAAGHNQYTTAGPVPHLPTTEEPVLSGVTAAIWSEHP